MTTDFRRNDDASFGKNVHKPSSTNKLRTRLIVTGIVMACAMGTAQGEAKRPELSSVRSLERSVGRENSSGLYPESSRNEILSQKVPLEMLNTLEAGQSQEVIVLFDDVAIQSEVTTMQSTGQGEPDKQAVLDYKREEYSFLKQEILSAMPMGDIAFVRDYSHLPLATLRVKNMVGLSALVDDPRVVRVYENRINQMFLTESLSLINQPEGVASGHSGEGTVAVLDSGVDYTDAAFGSCAAPGDLGCKVVYAQDFAADDGQLDDNGHGTNVAATVLGVAPETQIAALDVFEGRSASDAVIIQAINWAIANQVTYKIVAMNFSLGAPQQFSSACTDSPYTQVFAAARAAGILPIVAAGNEVNKNGISYPACTPGAVSVGAVYDADVGLGLWSSCLDFITATDQVTCFSNSAPYLTLLAPGAMITAAGITMAGTSQATPHVAGAVAVLRAAFPSETLEQTVNRMTSTGVPVQDNQNGLTHPRLDLMAAIEDVSPTAGSLELISPLGTINTSTPDYLWGAAPEATWYYLAIIDSGNQTVAAGYLSPEELDCSAGNAVCNITPNVPLAVGQSYRWVVYGGNDSGYERSEIGSFTVLGG